MRDVSRECSAETGIACSAETPRNRTNMRDVSRETYLLFNAFINGGICHFSHLDLIAISLSSSGFTHTSTNPNPNPNRLRWGRILVGPERTGWLTKQGEYIKTWRRRWFVLKQGKLFWFKESMITRASKPRGVIDVAKCLTVKGAKDALNKQYAFELSTRSETMYFIADSDKEKEDWINSIGRSVVQHSTSVTDSEIVDYDSKR